MLSVILTRAQIRSRCGDQSSSFINRLKKVIITGQCREAPLKTQVLGFKKNLVLKFDSALKNFLELIILECKDRLAFMCKTQFDHT